MNRLFAISVLLLAVVLTARAETPPEGALWNADMSAAATATRSANRTLVFAYVRQKDGSFVKVDLSAVENGAFGKLGHNRSDYERFETKPIEWLPRQDGLLQLRIQTQAWRHGKRYTVAEPVVIRPDGTILWR